MARAVREGGGGSLLRCCCVAKHGAIQAVRQVLKMVTNVKASRQTVWLAMDSHVVLCGAYGVAQECRGEGGTSMNNFNFIRTRGVAPSLAQQRSYNGAGTFFRRPPCQWYSGLKQSRPSRGTHIDSDLDLPAERTSEGVACWCRSQPPPCSPIDVGLCAMPSSKQKLSWGSHV